MRRMPNPLTAWRERHDPPVTQAALARQLGISRSFLKRLENGERKASVDLVRKIRDELGIAPTAIRPDLAADAALFVEAAE